MKINYFNFSKFNDEFLITNDFGCYCFISKEDLKALVNADFTRITKDKLDCLKERCFVYDENDDVFVEKVKQKYRDIKAYLFDATCLHIFVMTNMCNMNCVYCQAQDTSQIKKGKMNAETACKAVEIALQSPANHLTFEFQGGEPLLNFETIKTIVEYTEMRKNDKDIKYSLVTNTLLLSNEMIPFFKEFGFDISTSLDGNAEIHNANRKKCDGTETYDMVINNIRRLQEEGIPVGAIETTTRKSLNRPKQIVDAYANSNLHYLFVRPLTKLGFAKEHWEEIGYSAEEFIEFYRAVLGELIARNKMGYKISEGHASIFLRKIFSGRSDNYMELRSPCGAGVGQMAYYFDGKIYTCDEGRMMAEMGMPDFCLGEVDDLDYDGLMGSNTCKITCQASALEGIPGCCECVYHPYCGVCPVLNYASEKNIYSREANGFKCKIYRGILDTLFGYLHDDEQATEILKSWV